MELKHQALNESILLVLNALYFAVDNASTVFQHFDCLQILSMSPSSVPIFLIFADKSLAFYYECTQIV